jgi:alkylation response protein AidB-like acyl-CoA dehydrogenase
MAGTHKGSRRIWHSPNFAKVQLHATELNLRVAMFADELLGPYAQLERGSLGAIENGRWLYRVMRARGLTIAAGSSEIQHNIIGERVLKLPKG